MESYEFEGKTTEDAINNAANELNMSPEELDFEIIEPGSAGIFGLVGSRKAKIRVTIQEDDEIEDSDDPFNEKSDYIENSEKSENDFQEDFRETAEIQSESVDSAKEILEKILNLIPMETTVKGEQEGGKIHLTIQGDSSGLLIGRKGKTLDAIQFIVNKAINKSSDTKLKVVIDSENYRQKRIDSLTQMALKIGEKVKRLRKPLSTNPLNPHDRRIVHLALKNSDNLETRSRGEGLHKRVIIIPKN